MAVATRNTSQAAREIQDVLEERDVQGLGVIAVSMAGGVVFAQEVADRVLPALGFNREPTDAVGFLASAGTKSGVALTMGLLAARVSGLPLLVTAWSGAGALAGAGADLFNAIQRSGFLAEAPGNYGRSQSAREIPSQASTGSTGTGNSANGTSPSSSSTQTVSASV